MNEWGQAPEGSKWWKWFFVFLWGVIAYGAYKAFHGQPLSVIVGGTIFVALFLHAVFTDKS